MARVKRSSAQLVLAGVSALMLAPEAWAYLDPSTGSMILSAIIGVFATAALALKTFWYLLKAFFRRKPEEPPAKPVPGESVAPARPQAD